MSCCNHKPHTCPLFTDDYIIRNGNMDENLHREYLTESTLWIDKKGWKILGRCIYDTLWDLKCSGDIDLPENICYKTLLDYLFPIYVYGIKADLPKSISYQERNTGVVRATDPNGTFREATESEITAVEQRYQSKLNFYRDRLVKFMRCNPCFAQNHCGCCPVLTEAKTIFGIPVIETDSRYINRHIARKYTDRYYNHYRSCW